MSISKKTLIRIIIVVVIIILGIGLYWFSQKQAKKYRGPMEEITLAAYAGEAGTLVYVALDQGFFERNGLDIIIKDYESGKVAADAVIANEVDISTSAGFVFVSNSFDHTDLRILGTVSTFETKELVARKDKGITKIVDLKGKKIGVTKKSGGEFALVVFLTFNGLSQKDVSLIDLRPSEIVAAVVDGTIDAGFTWDPNVYDMKQALGDNAISWPGHSDFYFVLLTKKDWIEDNPGRAERFMKSLLEAEEYIKINSEASKEFVKKRFDYELDYINYTWPKQEFVVILEQAMLILFEDQARWKIENNLTDAKKVPNYLDYIYLDALETVKPDAVTVIK